MMDGRVKITVRMPGWVNHKLTEVAKDNGSSLNAIVVNACIKYADYFEKNYGPMIEEAKKNE
ncbi:hypothetical protein HCZ06_10000 [Limosilactobacillus fermentum]